MSEIIINGGKPLPGCPESWEQAKAWEEMANAGNEELDCPKWEFDCGFKLDYDGPLVSISSRFYPPKERYGATWDGTVSIRILGNQACEKSFDCRSLDELKKQVEDYVKDIAGKIKISGT